ncbi:MAG: universal stress protein [Labilithrix sp.]
MVATLVKQGDTILVGTSLDAPSAVALRRAVALANTFDAVVRVVHAVPWDAEPIRVREDALRRTIAEWAVRSARIILGLDMIACRVEEPAMALAREAVENDASLVVIGASQRRGPRAVAARFLHRASVPLLVAQSPGLRGSIVAATDLSDRNYPVAHAAVAWADACAARVTLIHNIERAPTSREAKRRQLWPALRDLCFLTRALGPIQRAHLSRAPSTPVAISKLVRAQSADLVVVGARRSGGRTMGEVLASTHSSVLVVPLGESRG